MFAILGQSALGEAHRGRADTLLALGSAGNALLWAWRSNRHQRVSSALWRVNRLVQGISLAQGHKI